MYLENIVVDALDPQLVGRFWEAVVGGEKLTDEPGIYETRLAVDGGPVLDLCFQQVGDAPTARSRLHLDLAGGTRQAEEVDRLLVHMVDEGLGAGQLRALGFTDELGLHYWFKRIGANRQLLGGPTQLREEAAMRQGLVEA